MGEEKEILLRGKVCAYLTGRLMGDPNAKSNPGFFKGTVVEQAVAYELGLERTSPAATA